MTKVHIQMLNEKYTFKVGTIMTGLMYPVVTSTVSAALKNPLEGYMLIYFIMVLDYGKM